MRVLRNVVTLGDGDDGPFAVLGGDVNPLRGYIVDGLETAAGGIEDFDASVDSNMNSDNPTNAASETPRLRHATSCCRTLNAHRPRRF